MLNSKDKVAVWMEGSLDDDYGKMGISAIRYLENEIVCVIDSTHSGKVVSDVSQYSFWKSCCRCYPYN